MPIGTTAAIIGAGVLGAGASVLGAKSNAKAISQSTDTSLQANRESIAAQERALQQQLAFQTNAFNASSGMQSDLYNSTGQLQVDTANRNANIFQPWVAGGGAAFNQMNAMLGLPQQTFTAPEALTFTPVSPTTIASAQPAQTPQQTPNQPYPLMNPGAI